MNATTSTDSENFRSRLRPSDLLRLGSEGTRTKPLRAVLSGLGIAIGVAAMLAVLGISSSSQARLNERLAQLGTNLLSAESASVSGGAAPPLPVNASARLHRLPGVESTSFVGVIPDVFVYRSSYIDPALSGGLTVNAADHDLLKVVAGSIRAGRWFTDTTARFPTTVLGSDAATRLGVSQPGTLVWLGGRNALVIGILHPVDLAPELDVAALVGLPNATEELGFHGNPTRLYVRVDERAVTEVRTMVAPSVRPDAPSGVAVSRPSDALAAVAAVDEAFTGMLLGLGSISLLVGAIGVANTMVISVMERRKEIGLRRALGATRRHIRLQFLAEALTLSALGGIAGAAIGWLVTAIVAASNGWETVVPILVPVVGVSATLVVGALAGLYPAIRAARTPPNAALSSG